jgi:hypothetical protein
MRDPSCAQSNVLLRQMKGDVRCKEPTRWVPLSTSEIIIRKADVSTSRLGSAPSQDRELVKSTTERKNNS